MKTNAFYLFISLVAIMLWACGAAEQKSQESAGASPGPGQSAVKDDVSNPNVVQIAIGSKDHSTLVAALKAAEYVDALTNVGPFTVFAPVNAGFDKLPAGTVDNLLKKENKKQLQDVLEYHVLLGVYRTESLRDGQNVGTAQGKSVSFSVDGDGKVKVNGNPILASIPASNGIIHVIDGVLLPN
jgi:uncharacterized surface protein with fasciclin (FAS1) repeats